MTTARLSALGLVNSLGFGRLNLLPRLLEGDQSGLTLDTDSVPGRRTHVGAVTTELEPLPKNLAFLNSRNSRLIATAYNQIRQETERAASVFGWDRIGIVLGSSTSGIANTEELFDEISKTGLRPRNYNYAQQEIGAVSETLAGLSGARGPCYTISTACSSSAKVFASVRNLLHTGICDAVLVGGADSLCRLTLNGFADLDLLSENPCNPMSRNRCGISIGEGAAIFLIERVEGGIQLLGVGESSDAYHISSPDPEAKGAINAMHSALRQAGVAPRDIAYVNLHGTGTMHNDAMESRAVNEVFGDSVKVSSTKPLVGHMLGAAGATEIGFLWMLLTQSPEAMRLPPHRWDGVQDDTLPLLDLVETGEVLRWNQRKCCMMSTSFGFGGSNCAVIIGRNE